jgi:hypothetical protein
MAACTRDASKQTAKPHVCKPADNTWAKGETDHYQLCSCGEKVNVGEHVFGEWEIYKEATEDTDGMKKSECEVCGKKETQKYSLNASSTPAESTSSVDANAGVGKPTFPVVPVAIGGGALVVIVAVVVIILAKKKKK